MLYTSSDVFLRGARFYSLLPPFLPLAAPLPSVMAPTIAGLLTPRQHAITTKERLAARMKKLLTTPKTNRAKDVTPEQWTAAFERVDLGYKISEVAKAIGVPWSTLKSRLETRSSSITKFGASTALTAAHEARLADHVLYMANAGFALTKTVLQELARNIAADAGIDPRHFCGGDNWYYGFMARHPEISQRSTKKTNGARSSKFNRIIVPKWFAASKPVFEQYTDEELWNADDKHVNSEELVPKQVRSKHANVCVVGASRP